MNILFKKYLNPNLTYFLVFFDGNGVMTDF